MLMRPTRADPFCSLWLTTQAVWDARFLRRPSPAPSLGITAINRAWPLSLCSRWLVLWLQGSALEMVALTSGSVSSVNLLFKASSAFAPPIFVRAQPVPLLCNRKERKALPVVCTPCECYKRGGQSVIGLQTPPREGHINCPCGQVGGGGE